MATLRITPPTMFRHAGDLPGRFDSADPRSSNFDNERVDVDLRACDFLWPSAVLWCGVYALLAARRSGQCRLLVPVNLGVSVYLKSIGLFSVLQEAGIELDDRGVRVPRGQQQHILPVTRFEREEEVEELANQALDGLSRAGLGSANLYPLVSEVFAELAMNAVQHSESPVGSLGLIQFYEFQQGSASFALFATEASGLGVRLKGTPLFVMRFHTTGLLFRWPSAKG